MLKPLLLPQKVERERRQLESMYDGETDDFQCYDLQDSKSASHSPITPTFSGRGHVRYSSSVSSLDALVVPLTEIPSSPSFTGKVGGKNPLPDVEEERDEHFDMFDDRYDVYDWSCDDTAYNQYEDGMAQSSIQLSTQPEVDYDLSDAFVNDNPAPFNMPTGRKRAHSDSPFANITDRLSTRFPGFSRKWSGSKAPNPLTPIVTSISESRGQSRAPSTRSSSISNSVHQTAGISISYSSESRMPPTPARSEFNGLDSVRGSEDLLRDERDYDPRAEGLATTPLLPPLMMGNSSNSADDDIPVQSPLQSPSIADTFDAQNRHISPLVTHSHTPSLLPSPPLSTKPSISSMRPVYPLSHTAHPSQLLGPLSPTMEVSNNLPPFTIAQEDDKWSNILGHANFTIYPEPYMPEVANMESCTQLRAAWEQARCGFMRHLVRTGEHYGDRSDIYRKTEEKWKEVDEDWRSNNDSLIAQTSRNEGTDEDHVRGRLGQQSGGGSMGESGDKMLEMPKLNDVRSGGKFLELGDEDIVGPMHRDEGMASRSRSRSRTERIKKFFTGMVGKVSS